MPRTLHRMPADIAELLRRDGGVVVAARARAAGVDGHRLSRLVAARLLTRIGPGQYVPARAYEAADYRERHRLKARAFALTLSQRGEAYLTGWSGGALHNLPMIGRPPASPEAVRPRSKGHQARSAVSGKVLAAELPEYHMGRVDGVGVMSPAWIVADLARRGPIPSALVAADAVARTGVALHDAVDYMHGWLGVARARWVAERADPLAETPIETLGRFTVIQFALPMPVLNAWVGQGEPEFRLDGLWPYHWAGYEADGAQKYDNRPDASVIISKQVDREWYLRRLGLDLARYTWQPALNDRRALAGQFWRLLQDNPARPEPIRWWKHVPGQGPVEPQPADWPSPEPSSITLPAGWNL